jgi:hypothetical protein
MRRRRRPTRTELRRARSTASLGRAITVGSAIENGSEEDEHEDEGEEEKEEEDWDNNCGLLVDPPNVRYCWCHCESLV